jgi:hypothetical protein
MMVNLHLPITLASKLHVPALLPHFVRSSFIRTWVIMNATNPVALSRVEFRNHSHSDWLTDLLCAVRKVRLNYTLEFVEF